jgi:hypothetical protein
VFVLEPTRRSDVTEFTHSIPLILLTEQEVTYGRVGATRRKVAGSRPEEVNAFFFFNVPNPSGCTRPWGLLSL